VINAFDSGKTTSRPPRSVPIVFSAHRSRRGAAIRRSLGASSG